MKTTFSFPDKRRPRLSSDLRLLAGPPYESLDLLIEDMNTWAKSHGLAFVKRRSNNYIEVKADNYSHDCHSLVSIHTVHRKFIPLIRACIAHRSENGLLRPRTFNNLL